MYGSDPFGSVPYGAGGAEAFDYEAMLASSREELVYTVTLTTWHTATDEEHIHYYASKEWATSPTDIPASQPFDGRVITPLQFSRSIVGDRIGINHTSGEGQIVIANGDGEMDDFVDTHAVDSRQVVVRIGRTSDPFADHLVIFDGLAHDVHADVDTATITIRDKSAKLDVPAQPNVYAGTGDAEGGADLTGKRKPLVLGLALGVEPSMISSSLLIYQVHDGSAYLIRAAWDRGVVLTTGNDHANYAALAAATVAAGTRDTCAALGLFRLASAPDGVVLGGAQRVNPFDNTPGAILELLERVAVLSDDEIDRGSFHAIDATSSEVIVNFYLGPGDVATAAEAVARLMSGVGGWGGFTRNGKFAIGIFAAPSGDPVAYFDHDEGGIVVSPNRERLPSGMWPPPWRCRVAYALCFTVFTDFAGSVGESTKVFFSQPYRLASAEDASVSVDHLQAQDLPPIESLFQEELDAQDEAGRLLTLYSSGYRLYRMTLPRRALLLEIGDVIHVTSPRFGLDGGVLMRVAEISDNIQIGDGSEVDQVEIVAFG